MALLLQRIFVSWCLICLFKEMYSCKMFKGLLKEQVAEAVCHQWLRVKQKKEQSKMKVYIKIMKVKMWRMSTGSMTKMRSSSSLKPFLQRDRLGVMASKWITNSTTTLIRPSHPRCSTRWWQSCTRSSHVQLASSEAERSSEKSTAVFSMGHRPQWRRLPRLRWSEACQFQSDLVQTDSSS